MRRETSGELPNPQEQSLDDVVVLMPIGGQATRAREVTGDNIPKHLIRLGNNQPVLDVVCRGLQRVGFRQFTFCVGHHKDQIREHIDSGSWVVSKGVEHEFSEEKTPLGPDGAIMQAIDTLGLTGQGLVVPGDMMLPWDGIAAMNREHAKRGADVTVGVTSHVTDRTTDVGRMVVEEDSDRLLWCYGRTDDPGDSLPGSRNLTSAAAMALTISRYVMLCETYLDVHPDHVDKPLSLRDQVLPWAINVPDFQVDAYDTQGEALDLGTPANIYYGQENWEQYV
jgi:NDP-sugar pyrophosphorylase family protein